MHITRKFLHWYPTDIQFSAHSDLFYSFTFICRPWRLQLTSNDLSLLETLLSPASSWRNIWKEIKMAIVPRAKPDGDLNKIATPQIFENSM